MKKNLLSVFAAMIAMSSVAQSGFEGIIVEKFYVSDAADSTDAADNLAVYPLHAGSVTYRVYADLVPGYKVINLFGSPTHTMNIATTTAFYNDPNYGFGVYNGLSVNNTKKNTALIDSYLTIGGVATGKMGVLKTEDTDGTIGNLQNILANADASAGIPITGATGVDGLMPGTPVVPNTLGLSPAIDIFDQTVGGTFEVSNGAIAALGGVEGVTASNTVLLGQFTTDGIFSFKLNLQIGTPVAGESQLFVAESPATGETLDSTLTYVSTPTTGISAQEVVVKVGASYSVFPNPTSDFITVHQFNQSAEKASAKIIDLSGRVVYTTTMNSEFQQMDVSELASGIYMIRFEKKGQIETLKFIKK
jgi:hypothetical protein